MGHMTKEQRYPKQVTTYRGDSVMVKSSEQEELATRKIDELPGFTYNDGKAAIPIVADEGIVFLVHQDDGLLRTANESLASPEPTPEANG